MLMLHKVTLKCNNVIMVPTSIRFLLTSLPLAQHLGQNSIWLRVWGGGGGGGVGGELVHSVCFVRSE